MEEEGGGRQQPSLHVVIKRTRRQARDRARALRNRNPKAARIIIYSSRGASLLEWRDDSLSSLSPRTIPFLRGEKGSRSKALPVSFRSSRDWSAKCLLEREEGEYFVDFKRVKIEMIKFLRSFVDFLGSREGFTYFLFARKICNCNARHVFKSAYPRERERERRRKIAQFLCKCDTSLEKSSRVLPEILTKKGNLRCVITHISISSS